MESRTQAVSWHTLFAYLLEKLLTVDGLMVLQEVEVGSKPPRVDVVLVRTDPLGWSEEQLRWLPDGIRESGATHILIEFKYTESISEDAVEALVAHEILYRRNQRLPRQQVQSVLVSAHSPWQSRREGMGFVGSSLPGVYTYTQDSRLTLLDLSSLADTPYNSFFTLFAHQQQVKRQAILRIQSRDVWPHIPREVVWLFMLLLHLWKWKGETPMLPTITKEDLMELDQDLPRQLLSSYDYEDFLAILGDTPHIQCVRAEGEARGRAEGEARGRAEGEARGRAEGEARGRAEGEAHGILIALRRSIVESLSLRFGISETAQEQLMTVLQTITDELSLQALFKASVQAESFAAFQAMLEERTAMS